VAEYMLTGKAEQDLSDIIEYTKTRWGRSQTSIYIDSIEARCQMLADNPSIGKGCDDIANELMRHPIGSHVIYYIRQGQDISIIRILYKRMLPSKHL